MIKKLIGKFNVRFNDNDEENYRIIDYNLRTMDQNIIGKNFEKLKKVFIEFRGNENTRLSLNATCFEFG